jgi:hypothetical protein
LTSVKLIPYPLWVTVAPLGSELLCTWLSPSEILLPVSLPWEILLSLLTDVLMLKNNFISYICGFIINVLCSSKNSFKFVYRITHNNMVIKRPPPPKRSSQSSEIRTSHNDTRTHSEARSSHSDRSSHSSESNMRKIIVLNLNILFIRNFQILLIRNKILWSYKETKCIKKVLIN